MARLADEVVERLKREVSLERLVRASGVELKKHGENLLGRCPYHDDREPSLVVRPSKNLWHCLGACQAGGSVIDYVMRRERCSYRAALELLLKDAPVLAASLESAPPRTTSAKLYKRRVSSLPVVDDAVFARHCPADILLADWVATRRDLGKFLNVPAERLSPAMTLQGLADHFRCFGLPRIHADFETLEEVWAEKVGSEFSQTLAIQEVVVVMTRHFDSL